jgi:ElaB/YqjD/DUF883 family membrane-anchored ribosome-binding protein
MVDKEPTGLQFHRYQPPNVVPLSSRPAPVSAILGVLRDAGIPENVIDQVRGTLESIGITNQSLEEARDRFVEQTRKASDWSKENPQKAAGVLAVVAGSLGLLIVLLARRR